MNTDSHPTILLVEDDENLGFLLKDNLQAAGFNVLLCPDGLSGFDKFVRSQVSLCILDVMLPGKDVFTLAKEIRSRNPQVPLIFLTARGEKEERIQGFKLGADDYITKPFSIEELILRIEAILKRTSYLSGKESRSSSYAFGNSCLDDQNLMVNCNGKEMQLTYKEHKLLKFLVTHANQLLDRNLIMKTIWEDDGFFVGRSLDVFISRLRKILSPDPSIQILNIHGIGYKLEVKNQI